MKISAFAAEFNPFHRGHAFLIDNMRQNSDAVIAIMSGNFVQRGECALFDKTERAAAAVKNGVDLVIELPCVYALSSAEGFARGAVKILAETNLTDSLWFGSECGDISALSSLAKALNGNNPRFDEFLTEKLSSGASFPLARSYALDMIGENGALLNSPNNILAVEYIRALEKYDLKIKPFTVKRIGSGYNDTETLDNLPSASIIRGMVKSGKNAQEYLSYNYSSSPLFMRDLDSFVALRLKTVSEDELCLIPDCNAEIAARLKKAAVFNSIDAILSHASCRRYTQSRLRRILCNLIINNTFKALPSPSYIRPLAFNSLGSELLHKMKSTASLPVASRGAVLKNDDIFRLECRATDVCNLARKKEGGEEFRLTPCCF